MGNTDAIARTSGGGFGRFLITLVLLSIIASSLAVMMTRAHARRHDKHVKDIPDKCNSNSSQLNQDII